MWPLAMLLGAALIAAAIMVGGRFELAAGSSGAVWRLDRWTGQMSHCQAPAVGDDTECRVSRWPR